MNTRRIDYTPMPPFSSGMPIVEVKLSSEHTSKILQTPALVDSGAAINLLPYDYGLELGFIWEEQRLRLPSGGLLMGTEMYAVRVDLEVEPFPKMGLAFGWVKKSSHEVRTLLGQIDFFRHFRILFDMEQQYFELEFKG